ncbi:ATP-binding protein [Portibacter marinus]|uniref:ATP-binding protein n=1 Tax=Portibacter marinus TaxID=2898660 RepID=UPI001F46578D|nr:ATP-binding protein [Portibacter marinus]
MTIKNQFGFIQIAILASCLLFFSCQKTSVSATETKVGNYKIPETIPLKFTDPEPFEWETIADDTLLTPVTYPLNVDALPSQPFDLNQFRPLKKPMLIEDLNWDGFSEAPLEFDSVPYTITQSPIKKPEIIKMPTPSILEEANANLLQLTTDIGLSTNRYLSFLENEDGSLWVGAGNTATPSGLYLYEGENASIYNYNAIFGMASDKKGRLWLAAGNSGIYMLDFESNVEYKIARKDENLFGGDVMCDHEGMIYIATWGDGFYTIDPELENFRKIKNTDNFAAKLFEDSQHNVWLGSRDSLMLIDQKRQSIKDIAIDGIQNRHSGVSDIIEDSGGSIWISLYSYFKAINTDEAKLVRISSDKTKISTLTSEQGYDNSGHSILEDNEGNFWVTGLNDIFILDKDVSSFKKIRTSKDLTTVNQRLESIKRKDGTLWLGTVGKGILIANRFTPKTSYFDSSTGLMHDEVWNIMEDSRGEIWLGTLAGINIIDPKKGTIRSLSQDQLHNNRNVSIGFIKEITPDKYLFRAAANGFSIYDRQKNEMTQYLSNSKVTREIWDIEMINEHTFYLYATDGLYFYDIEARRLKKLVSSTDQNVLKNEVQVNFTYDGADNLWFGNSNDKGIANVNVKDKTLRYLSETEGLCDNNANVVRLIQEGELWVSTLEGVSILNFEDKTLTNLKAENGLIPHETYDLVEKDSIVYVASVNGLIPVNKYSGTQQPGYINYNAGYGFLANDYLQNSPTFLKNGQFWSGVATPEVDFKLLIMDEAPKPDSSITSIHLASMYVMDEEVEMDSVVLPYDRNSLRFNFGSSDIYNTDKINYRYILEGNDEDWTFVNTQTSSKNYYNLKPGPYTFKVASRGVNQLWSSPVDLQFRIKPPWWQTWWAYLIFAVIAASLLRAYIVWRARKLKRENKLLEQKVNVRTKELKTSLANLKSTQSQLIQSEKMASLGELTAGIAHEIQNPLNFVNNFSELSNELMDEMNEELESGDIDEAKLIAVSIQQNLSKITHHGKRADAIVKGMLQHSRKSSAENEPTDINKLADEYLRLAYHGLRAKDKSFNAKLDTDFDESIGLIHIIPQDIGRVILNLITNAFYAVKEKKSKSDQEGIEYSPIVSVSTKKEKGIVVIDVEDNGGGIPSEVMDKIFQPFFTTKPTGEGTGLGLSMSYDIVTKGHGGELKVQTEEGVGTTFSIKMPHQ